ncbi:MAG: hypothetical protein ACN0LA_13095 [Candidatus Longimicrobiales bacterium M2_2A_002]
MRKWIAVALVGLVATACDESTGLGGSTQVSVDFATRATTSASVLGFGQVARSMDVNGSNGVLTLDTVHVIVNEFELERVEDLAGCDSTSAGEDDDFCEEFETGPSLLNLPLEGGTSTAVMADIPEGEYDEIEFEIEDLEDDEDDPVEAAEIEDLRTEILAQFPDWPRKGSVRVVGTFTPTGGDPVPFTVYAEAEIEVELEFASPFVVTADDVSRTITVEFSPSDWFLRDDGSVLDLSQYDYDTTGMVPEFDVEIEDGFEGAEHDDD